MTRASDAARAFRLTARSEAAEGAYRSRTGGRLRKTPSSDVRVGADLAEAMASMPAWEIE